MTGSSISGMAANVLSSHTSHMILHIMTFWAPVIPSIWHYDLSSLLWQIISNITPFNSSEYTFSLRNGVDTTFTFHILAWISISFKLQDDGNENCIPWSHYWTPSLIFISSLLFSATPLDLSWFPLICDNFPPFLYFLSHKFPLLYSSQFSQFLSPHSLHHDLLSPISTVLFIKSSFQLFLFWHLWRVKLMWENIWVVFEFETFHTYKYIKMYRN